MRYTILILCFPGRGGLTLDMQLGMQRAIGHPTRDRLLPTLDANHGVSASVLDAIDVETRPVHPHLFELLDVALIDKRQ